MLATTTLQLYGTHWQEDLWRSKDILFPVSDKKVWIGRPVISRAISTASILSQGSNASSFPIRNQNLLSLAISLTELGLGKPLPSCRSFIKEFRLQTRFEELEIVSGLSESQGILSGELGPDYAEVFAKCAHFNFGVEGASLDYKTLVPTVHRDVVLLLKDYIGNLNFDEVGRG